MNFIQTSCFSPKLFGQWSRFPKHSPSGVFFSPRFFYFILDLVILLLISPCQMSHEVIAPLTLESSSSDSGSVCFVFCVSAGLLGDFVCGDFLCWEGRLSWVLRERAPHTRTETLDPSKTSSWKPKGFEQTYTCPLNIFLKNNILLVGWGDSFVWFAGLLIILAYFSVTIPSHIL